jgi:hypothetical protein
LQSITSTTTYTADFTTTTTRSMNVNAEEHDHGAFVNGVFSLSYHATGITETGTQERHDVGHRHSATAGSGGGIGGGTRLPQAA